MKPQFTLEHDEEENCLLNIKSEDKIASDDLQEVLIDDEILAEVFRKHVIISGKAPIFIYMYAALRVFQAGAAQIAIRQVQAEKPFLVFPTEDAGPGDHVHAAAPGIVEFGDSLVCEYHCSNSAPIGPADLPALVGALPLPSHAVEKIVIAGKMPIWLAAAVAVSAQLKGWKTIEYLMPSFDGPVLLFPNLKMGKPLPELQKHGIVIGIVGDPNSGKSVFAELLEQAGAAAGADIWRYDCDYAAPTPNWYLDMMKIGRNREGSEWRRSYKRKWVAGAEEELVAELQNIRKYIDVIIADLPGGRHEKDFVQRLPPGREILFHEADFFIIVAKRQGGCDSGEAWKNELAKIGMASKIVQTIYSELPEQDISLHEADGQWHILGLDRTHTAAAPVKAELWKLIRGSFAEPG